MIGGCRRFLLLTGRALAARGYLIRHPGTVGAPHFFEPHVWSALRAKFLRIPRPIGSSVLDNHRKSQRRKQTAEFLLA